MAVKNCYELDRIGSQKFTFLHRVFTYTSRPGVHAKEDKKCETMKAGHRGYFFAFSNTEA
jgi:hypothetical protein